MSTLQVETDTTARLLEEKIRTRQAKVGIVGLGYVGLPLAVEFSQAGFGVTGIGLSDSHSAQVNARDSYVGDEPRGTLKPLENTFRMINIGLANEFALMCDRMGINVWEVIDAAATKPFGFMPFYPGPGLGGHCIPIDPFYLSWKTKQAGIEARFIELAGHINGSMPPFIVDKIQNALNDHSKPLKRSRIHILGVAYKKNIEDVRESPALDIMQLLM